VTIFYEPKRDTEPIEVLNTGKYVDYALNVVGGIIAVISSTNCVKQEIYLKYVSNQLHVTRRAFTHQTSDCQK
jgi:hypothetical protein